MIFDEKKKLNLNEDMSSKRKIEKVNALLRQRQNELITSLEAETEEIQNSTIQLLSSTIQSSNERSLVNIILF